MKIPNVPKLPKIKKELVKREGRNRVRPEDTESGGEEKKLSNTYRYTSRRYDEDTNTGRQGDKEEESRERVKSTTKRFTQICIGTGVLLIIFALFTVFHLSSNPKIIYPSGSSGFIPTTEVNSYKAEIKKLLSSSIWNGNKITVNSDGIRSYMLNEYPEIDNMALNFSLLSTTPKVYIQPSAPALVLNRQNASYAVDTKGIAIQQLATSTKQFANLPLVKDDSTIVTTIGKQALTTTDITFIQTVVTQLNAKGYQVQSMQLPAQSAELDVYLEGVGYYIKFNLQDNDPRQQAGTFLATAKLLKQQNVTPAQYVDVRVDGRAYYK